MVSCRWPWTRSALQAAILIALSISMTGQATAANDQPHPPVADFVTIANKVAKPLWSELTALDRQALLPLADEWDDMDALQKKKWLAISGKFAGLNPEQQARLQVRMREWSKLTPDERHVARESYSRAKGLGKEQKTAEWERYQLLTEEQKKKLAEEAAARKRVANLPSPKKEGAAKSPAPAR